ncbi:putative hemolysin [Novosphingobium capsulatum]|uniref:Hemolysin n=1 Tax=Novosphingobium capsulatum TaxID=13688 RepID=A0ABU1MS21_9SPHN|nr:MULTISPECIES: hemolysin family protein [Novosphingobium]MBB3360071.1 putative hemolysin [Novosphingobium sp. BK256]MBB3376440.1 putative hemolysin [Novosphingobium sp. BK280]MBB3380844.1 putative hemolysin [Novosphingobium sp. BK258]MBB3422504.1 putative hemolysin [Novosphingobium sp. BK267]MBB3451195.1 putative hemolysin [Novosphingobium sp. BK352]MBB3479703.1 putative hemolysin [Novosphingobium sp. BK369]MBB3503017.1 putative hemolysin [Novosphingobium sp. BK336]MBB3538813.1 putative h
MTSFPWPDALVILGLVVLNGLFSMSELAIVSARPARLKVLAEGGSGGAKVALELAADPGKFLSTVQIGITLVGIVAGAYSGSSLGGPVGERLAALGVPAAYAAEAGFALVIAVTTYLSLVVGELVPKQLALNAAEPIAVVAARPMVVMSRVTAPFVWTLNRSSGLILRLLGLAKGGEQEVTAEELQMIFAEATRSGVIEEEERALMASVMRLADRPVREVMTPRIELHWIEQDAQPANLDEAIEDSPHSLLLVADGSVDRIVGVVKVRDILAARLRGVEPALASLMKKPAIVPDRLDTMDALRVIQQAEVAMALVHDEYGHLEGIVTPADLLAAIAGNFVAHGDEGDAPMIVEREDGSLLIAGALPADAMADRLGIDLPEDRDYATAAGFALSVLRKLPTEGEHFAEQGWRFEVVDMDGRKIDKLLIQRAKAATPPVELDG